MREWNELKSTPFFHPFELPFGFLDAIWARKRRCSNNCSNAIYLFHLKTEPSLITFKRLHTYTLNIWNTKTSKVRSFVLWIGFTFNQTHFHRLHRHSIYLSIHPSTGSEMKIVWVAFYLLSIKLTIQRVFQWIFTHKKDIVAVCVYRSLSLSVCQFFFCSLCVPFYLVRLCWFLQKKKIMWKDEKKRPIRKKWREFNERVG